MASTRHRKSDIRVALFSGNYNYVKDGANQALNRLVEYLLRQDVAVRIYSPTTLTPAFEPVGTLISVPSISFPGRGEYRLATGLPDGVREDLKAFRPTLFHIAAPDFLGWSAQRLAKAWNCPVVASVHTRFETYLRYYNLGWLEPLALAYLRRFYGGCARMLVPTDCMIAELKSSGIKTDMQVWSRGVDLQRFSPQKRSAPWRHSLGFADNEVVIAFVGRVVKEKNLSLFADMCDGLSTRGIANRILVVGDGPARTWFEKRLPDAVFTGFLGGEDLARAYASSDVFFNPSTTETFGNVTLEAMASGLAVVAARATGSQSIITDQHDGLLYDPDDHAACLAHLERTVLDRATRNRLAQAAVARATHYDWDVILSSVVDGYRQVTDGQSPSRADQWSRGTGPAYDVGATVPVVHRPAA